MSKPSFSTSRRTILKSALGVSALDALGPFGNRSGYAAGNLTVGVIYVGPRDSFGYNEAQTRRRRSSKNCQA